VAAKFKEIKDKAGDSSPGVYLANRFVRQRLQAISEEAPYHLSAKLLAKQGFGLRPRYLTKQALAAELLRKIATMKLPAVADPYSISSGDITALKAFEEKIRKIISELESYTERNHTQLLDETKGLADAARNLVRKFDDRREIWEKYDELIKAQRALEKVDGNLRKKLSGLSGGPIRK
jgi:iron uptake system EfeUOB component EfeO/EfeM